MFTLAVLAVLLLLACLAPTAARRLASTRAVLEQGAPVWRRCDACGCTVAGEGLPDGYDCPRCGLPMARPQRPRELVSGAAIVRGQGGEPICHGCGYSLTGLARTRPCPECGLIQPPPRVIEPAPRHARGLRWLGLLSIVGYVPGLFSFGHEPLSVAVIWLAIYPFMLVLPMIYSVALVGVLARSPHTSLPWAGLFLLTAAPLCVQLVLIGVSSGWHHGGWFDNLSISIARLASPLFAALISGALFTCLCGLALAGRDIRAKRGAPDDENPGWRFRIGRGAFRLRGRGVIACHW